MSNTPKPVHALYHNMTYVDADYHKNHPQLLHTHNDLLELFFVVEGEGSYIVDNREYYVSPGCMIVCNQDVIHGESPVHKGSKISYCCALKNIQLPYLPKNTLFRRGINAQLFFDVDFDIMRNLFVALYDLTQRKGAGDEICQELGNIILRLTLERLSRRMQLDEIIQQPSEIFVQNISTYINAHFTENLSMEDLSQRFQVSPYYLAKIFKAETGMTPSKYIAHRKIGEAQDLLAKSDIPINEIGARMGFYDNAYFTRTFRKYVGTTPSEFREHFQGKEKDPSPQEN